MYSSGIFTNIQIARFQTHCNLLAQSPQFPSLRLNNLLRLLRSSLKLCLELLTLTLNLTLSRLEALVVRVNPANLSRANSKDKRVHSSERNVLGSDDEAPASPDSSGAHERKVLGEGEGFGGTGEVRCTGEDHAPFHYWSPGEALV
jgi:hypothetical protein